MHHVKVYFVYLVMRHSVITLLDQYLTHPFQEKQLFLKKYFPFFFMKYCGVTNIFGIGWNYLSSTKDLAAEIWRNHLNPP